MFNSIAAVGRHFGPVNALAAAAITSDGLAEHILDEFGEAILYKPAGGTPREIWANVERRTAADLPGAGDGVGPVCLVTVANDATLGISADEIDTGGDLVNLALRLGEAATDRPIVEVDTQDNEMMDLIVR